jgi:histone H2B
MAPSKSPAAEAKKTVKTVKVKKATDGKKKNKRRQETFALYIYKVLR